MRKVRAGNLLFLLFALYIASITFAQSDSSKPAVPKGYPVTFYSDTLFTVYNGIGPFSAGQRAEAIELKLNQVAKKHLNPAYLLLNSVNLTYYPLRTRTRRQSGKTEKKLPRNTRPK